MGCNASTHPPWCNCGFGGYQGYTPDNSSSVNSFARFDSNDAYCINRNNVGQSFTTFVKCRNCLQYIYLYKSPYGSWVLFDQLGSPWPKHSCLQVSEHANEIYEISDTGQENVVDKEWHAVEKITHTWSGRVTLDAEKTWVNLNSGSDEFKAYDNKSPLFFKYNDTSDTVSISGLKTDEARQCYEYLIDIPILKDRDKDKLRKKYNKNEPQVRADRAATMSLHDRFFELKIIVDRAQGENNNLKKERYMKRFIRIIGRISNDFEPARIQGIKNKAKKVFGENFPID